MPQNMMNGINAAENRVRSQNQRSWELTHQGMQNSKGNMPSSNNSSQCESAKNTQNSQNIPEISQIKSFLSDTNPEQLMLIMLIILLVKEGGDYILIAALIYILM